MSVISERWRRVTADFGAVVQGVSEERWDQPSPCDGWTARDIVDHLVGWVPPFLAAGTDVLVLDTVGLDPADGWPSIAAAVQQALDDADIAGSMFDHPQAGAHPLADAVDRFIGMDVLVHTWDLATATGQGVDLDAQAVAFYLSGFQEVDEDMLVASGQFGPRVDVPDGSSPQRRLLALTGRQA